MNKIVLLFLFSTLFHAVIFSQNSNKYSLSIKDEDGAEIGRYFDIQIESINIAADTTLDFFLIPNFGIQDPELQLQYSSFLEMLKRNTGNAIESLEEEGTSINSFKSINKNWGDHIDVYIGDEFWNGTDDLVRSVINELNTGLGYEYFKESQIPVSKGWNFDYSNVEGRKDRNLEVILQLNNQDIPESAAFNVSGIFYLAGVNEKALNDFYYRLRDKIAKLLLFNKSYNIDLIENGEYDSYYFKTSKFSDDFFNLLKTTLALETGRELINDNNEINESPTANADPDIEISTDQIVTLNAVNSKDDGQITGYHWRQMFETKFGTEYMTSNIAELSDSLSQIATFTPHYPGNYKFKLTVTDNQGLTNDDFINVKVYPGSKKINMKGINTWAYFDPSLENEYMPSKIDEFVSKDRINWIEIAPYWFMENRYSNDVHPLVEYVDDAPGYTTPDSSIIKLINTCHDRGLKVLLRPTLEFHNFVEWRGVLEPTDWDKWFASYEVFIYHYAQIAQQTAVELYSVGNELSNSNKFTDKWINIIDNVRQLYQGDLTYGDSELSVGLSTINFWDKLDIISGSGYLPVTGKGDYWDTGYPPMIDPPFSVLIQSVENSINKFLLPAYQQYQKPVLIIEAGIGNTDGSNLTPWVWDYSGQTMDNREQADFYEALLQVITEKPWITGIFFFVYDIKSDFNFINSDWPFGHNPKDKPAREVLKYWYND